MKFPTLPAVILGLALFTELPAQEPAVATPVATAVASPAAAEAVTTSTGEKELTEQEILANENKLEAERLTHATNSMRAEIARLKLERELMTEKAAYDAAKRTVARQVDLDRLEAEKLKITQASELSKLQADKLASDLKTLQTEAALEITRLQNDITRIETAERRGKFADAKPVFLTQPLKENGIVVISDRRIPLNGLITPVTADYVTSRIQYWNNKDRELPIFIVIDASPGGSVMAGYRILKAMESSDAPIHVVVKSFAASMAAAITTLAEESYAYPNAVILHHQISSTIMRQLNLTEQREFHEESQRWWVRLGTPIADKMGITTDELIKKMYARSSSGDWSEFAEQAKELKWVNHIVQGIDETSVTKDPDATETTGRPAQPGALTEEVDANGQPYAWLPRLTPKDVYFLYNPDQYYRMR
ncbi:MAG: ATP-dependent Clp protease proteolytic subunit [Akkermansiaceae bacterium]